MQVILLKKIHKLGTLGDEVNVKAGYARNYLFPQNLALLANPANREIFVAKRKDLEAKESQELSDAQSRATAVEGLQVSIKARSAEGGKLYGSIRPSDVSKAFAEQHNIEIKSQEIVLPNGSISELGQFNFEVVFATSIVANASILVEGLE